ncbi:hypothetical protein ACIBAG_32350 [Streptomyces sp. NPDC051243]|uniref:hypothetical protein n=1 Tax=Streptomyces sp. NPDC051243 TaxID=3365646 RepID=UPI0037975AD9
MTIWKVATFLMADADGLRAVHFPAPDREVPYPRPEFEVAVVPGGIIVTARTLARASCVGG